MHAGRSLSLDTFARVAPVDSPPVGQQTEGGLPVKTKPPSLVPQRGAGAGTQRGGGGAAARARCNGWTATRPRGKRLSCRCPRPTGLRQAPRSTRPRPPGQSARGARTRARRGRSDHRRPGHRVDARPRLDRHPLDLSGRGPRGSDDHEPISPQLRSVPCRAARRPAPRIARRSARHNPRGIATVSRVNATPAASKSWQPILQGVRRTRLARSQTAYR